MKQGANSTLTRLAPDLTAGEAAVRIKMDWSDDPNEVMKRLMVTHEQYTDGALLEALRAVEPLEDENHPAWDDIRYWHTHACQLEALSRLASQRRLEDAIPLILGRMCNGDPGEIMRRVCHGFESMVAPDYGRLATHYKVAARSDRPGTRMWALIFLARLRDPATISVFGSALHDTEPEVRNAAERGFQILTGKKP